MRGSLLQATKPVHVPYKLSAFNGQVCAMGSDMIRRTLMRLDGSRVNATDLGPYVSFNPTREAIMACEAIAAPEFVAPEYIAIRQAIMSVSQSQLIQWRDAAPKFKRPLMRHQEEFCAIAYPRRGMFNGSEQGTGKTATVIALAEAWRCKLNIIVCPRSIISQWHMEWHEVLDVPADMLVVPLTDMTVADRIDAIEGLCDMEGKRVAVVLNYEALPYMRKMLVKLASEHSTFLELDEAWKIKSPTAKMTQAAIEIADLCTHVLATTGTPVAQGVPDLWSQIRAIQGPNDMETRKEWNDAYERIIWVNKGERKEKKSSGCKDPIGMMRRLSPWFYRATKGSCLDLPPQLPVQRIKFGMPPEMARLYKEVKENGEAALGDGSSLAGERSTLLRLQQILGGFVFNPDGTYTEDEAGQMHDLRLRLIHSPKMDWLEAFAEDQLLGDPTRRVIVWCKFNAEVHNITKRLKRILSDERVAMIAGEMKEPVLDGIKASFNSRDTDGVQVIVGQYKKLAYGHNLQAGDDNIYYSHTWSHVEKSQSRDRTHRYGRTAPVAYFELVMRSPAIGIKETVDDRVLAATDSLQDMQDRLSPDTVGNGAIIEE